MIMNSDKKKNIKCSICNLFYEFFYSALIITFYKDITQYIRAN